MVDISSTCCARASCTASPKFGHEGMKTKVYCKTYTDEGMVNVRGGLCSRSSCFVEAAWGVLSKGAATACRLHKGDTSGEPVFNFKPLCKVVDPHKVSRWGLL